jgi:hypothetical protein
VAAALGKIAVKFTGQYSIFRCRGVNLVYPNMRPPPAVVKSVIWFSSDASTSG